jgi:hypothetical protein
MKREADPQSDLHYKDLFSAMKTVGTEKVGDHECYKLELTSKATGKTETRYYDKNSGLLVRADRREHHARQGRDERRYPR